MTIFATDTPMHPDDREAWWVSMRRAYLNNERAVNHFAVRPVHQFNLRLNRAGACERLCTSLLWKGERGVARHDPPCHDGDNLMTQAPAPIGLTERRHGNPAVLRRVATVFGGWGILSPGSCADGKASPLHLFATSKPGRARLVLNFIGNVVGGAALFLFAFGLLVVLGAVLNAI